MASHEAYFLRQSGDPEDPGIGHAGASPEFPALSKVAAERLTELLRRYGKGEYEIVPTPALFVTEYIPDALLPGDDRSEEAFEPDDDDSDISDDGDFE